MQQIMIYLAHLSDVTMLDFKDLYVIGHFWKAFHRILTYM